jgi:hypothetical protein
VKTVTALSVISRAQNKASILSRLVAFINLARRNIACRNRGGEKNGIRRQKMKCRGRPLSRSDALPRLTPQAGHFLEWRQRL